jgi:hypothetical protein
MNKIRNLLLISAALAATSDMNYGVTSRRSYTVSEEYKRKKCKSCSKINSCHGVYKQYNKAACKDYKSK